jgi:hypothetical protein
MLESRRVATAFAWARRAGLLAPALGVEAAPGDWRRSGRILDRLDVSAGVALPDRRRTVRLAAIASGLGMGPHEAADWLRRRRHGRSEAVSVANLLDLAGRARGVSTSDQRWAWIHDAGPDLPAALLLIAAEDPRRRKLATDLRKLASRQKKGPRVDGGEVMEWLGIPPGPRVGELLRLARIEGLRGRLRTRRQVRLFLTERGAGRSPRA